MAIPTGVKVAVALAALVGAGFFVWKNSKTEDPNDVTFNTQVSHYKCTGGHEFTLTAGEARTIAKNNNGMITCPQCQAMAGDVFMCPSCNKSVDPVGHGQMPDNCPHCKKSMSAPAAAPAPK